MGLLDRIKLAAAAITGRVSATTWNWRSGTKPGHLFDGSKFKGSLLFPSNWGLDNSVLRDRSRAAYWDSTQARSIIGRLADNVVGTGLALESNPVWRLIGDQGMNDEQKHAMAREIELRFDLWASSTEPDAAGRWSLYQLQALEFLNRMRDGETINILRYSGDSNRMSPLSIQTIAPEQVCTPYEKIAQETADAAGRRIIDGIEVDQFGKETALFINDENNQTKWSRVPVQGPSGRRFVLHPVHADTLGAVRGTPLLAPLIHELQKITDYTVAELEAAIINAVLAVWIEPSAEANASRALQGIQRRGTGEQAPVGDTETKQTTFDKPGLIVQSLKAGEKIQSFDTKRPNVNFGEFVRQIERGLSASGGLPVSIMNMEATKSYSAIRAEMILFFRKVEIERAKCATQYNGPIFEAWFTEEVRVGRIKAPNFNDSPVIRRAWLNCSWNGDKLPSIDPLKEAKADSERIAQGVTTRERVAMEHNGSDAMENISRLAIENQALADANAPLSPAPLENIESNQNEENEDDEE